MHRFVICWLLPLLALLLLPDALNAQCGRIKRIELHPMEYRVHSPEAPANIPVPEPSVRTSEPSVPAVHMPLERYRITSRFGWRRHPVTGRVGFHNGIDLAARAQAVRCIMDGTVEDSGYHSNLGNYVRIDHGSVQSIYGHLSRIMVKPGQPVSAGYPIGITGRTGRATGEHLHLAIRRNGTYINPWRFLHGLIQHAQYKH